jgi:hypothetical protein
MIIAQHCYDFEKMIIRWFNNQNTAADFIELLVIED